MSINGASKLRLECHHNIQPLPRQIEVAAPEVAVDGCLRVYRTPISFATADPHAANSNINGRFMASIDLTEMPPGEYAISIAGALAEGNDALGRRDQGYFRTGYMVSVG